MGYCYITHPARWNDYVYRSKHTSSFLLLDMKRPLYLGTCTEKINSLKTKINTLLCSQSIKEHKPSIREEIRCLDHLNFVILIGNSDSSMCRNYFYVLFIVKDAQWAHYQSVQFPFFISIKQWKKIIPVGKKECKYKRIIYPSWLIRPWICWGVEGAHL